MSSLQISQGTFRLSDTKTLHLDSLTLNAGDSWAFVGANGSGKSALARALVKHPTVLILDEPLQGLDPLNRQLVRRFVDVLIRQGETQLLFVSHHAEDAPACITHRLEFVPEGERYKYVSGRCNN